MALNVDKRRRVFSTYLVIFLSLAGMVFFQQFTANVGQNYINVFVENSTSVCLHVINFNDSMIFRRSNFLYIQVNNCGNLELDGNLTAYVINDQNVTVESFSTDYYNVSTTGSFYYTPIWYSNYNLGGYTLRVRTDYNSSNSSSSSQITKSFNLTCNLNSLECINGNLYQCNDSFSFILKEYCPFGCNNAMCIYTTSGSSDQAQTGGGGGSGSVKPVTSIYIDYDRNMTMFYGRNYTFFVRVRNNGTEVIHNMTSRIFSPKDSVSPDIVIENLIPGDMVWFTYYVLFPEEQDMVDDVKIIDMGVFSQEISEKRNIRVRVLVLNNDRDACMNDFEYYSGLSLALKNEIERLKALGFDTIEAENAYLEVLEKLNQARSLKESERYKECSTTGVDEVRQAIDRVTKEMAKIQIEIGKEEEKGKEEYILPQIDYIWITIIVISCIMMIVIMFILFTYRRSKRTDVMYVSVKDSHGDFDKYRERSEYLKRLKRKIWKRSLDYF